jgi:hypothetical protein
MKKILNTVVAALLGALTSFAADIYVAPGGSSSGDGSLSRPLDLATALSSSSRARPGDTIWLRGGTYRGKFLSAISGNSGSPITVRSYRGEWAKIDSGVSNNRNAILQVSGGYVTFRDFEIMSSDTKRTTSISGSNPDDIRRGHGINVRGPNNRFINLIIHDTTQGIAAWTDAPDTEIYGCIIYNNGWQAPDRAHGHGIYLQNATGWKTVRNNIIFNQFERGIQIYGSDSALLRNIRVDHNVSFNNGILSKNREISANLSISGGKDGPAGMFITNNDFYGNSLKGLLELGGDPNNDLTFENNYTAHRARFRYWKNLKVSGNTFIRDTTLLEYYRNSSGTTVSWDKNNYFCEELLYSPFALYIRSGSSVSGSGLTFPNWKSKAGVDSNSTYTKGKPSGVRTVVRPNIYEPGRAHIVVYNWARTSSVSINLSSVLSSGQKYEVRNAQNYFASPVTTGTFGGSTISIPLGSLAPATPIGASVPPSSSPTFYVFVVNRI